MFRSVRRPAAIRPLIAAMALTSLGAMSAWATAPAHAAPETAGLDPALATAYEQASTTAHTEGVDLWITSGKRSRAEQQQMWRDGLARYGSAAEARKWVLPPNESTHVSGHAIDVGPQAGAAWLERYGYRWGLCRTFTNEWWHFEKTSIPGVPCPAMWPNAAVRADQMGPALP